MKNFLNRPLSLTLNTTILKHAVKTALAAVLSLTLTTWCGLEYGYWAVLSTIIVMQAGLGSSLKAGLDRVLGTIIGALVGIPFVLLFPSTPFWLGLGLFLTILLCTYLTGVHGSFRLAGITLAILILAGADHPTPLLFCMERVFEIFIGVMCAIGVSLLLWPAKAASKLQSTMAQELRESAQLYRLILHRFLEQTTVPSTTLKNQLHAKIHKNKELYSEARQETFVFRNTRSGVVQLMGLIERIYAQLLAMKRSGAQPEGYHQHLTHELNTLGEAGAQTMEWLADKLEHSTFPHVTHTDHESEAAPPYNLTRALADMEAKLQDLRPQNVTKQYPLQDIITFFSFYHSMKYLSEDLISKTKLYRP